MKPLLYEVLEPLYSAWSRRIYEKIFDAREALAAIDQILTPEVRFAPTPAKTPNAFGRKKISVTNFEIHWIDWSMTTKWKLFFRTNMSQLGRDDGFSPCEAACL